MQFGLGDVVRHFRKRRNLSIHELADQSGTSATMIEKLEDGVSDPPLTDVVKVVKTLGFDLWEAYQQLRRLIKRKNLKIVRFMPLSTRHMTYRHKKSSLTGLVSLPQST